MQNLPPTDRPKIHVVGGGLAGSEAAHFLANLGLRVLLHEMRPTHTTPAHKTADFGELVCSNSFKSADPLSAPGILKAEMSAMGSLVLECASQCRVGAGEALAVDREIFSKIISEKLRRNSLIEISREEVRALPSSECPDIWIFATGPLTSDSLADSIANRIQKDQLYFYDAIAPIVDAATIDRSRIFMANRYDKGIMAEYLNCPLTEAEYGDFVSALLAAEITPSRDFEKEIFFQGCQPIETIARSGFQSLRHGPMKPVGLVDPKTGRIPYAAIQLRAENLSATAYNIVGFQTRMRYPEQKRVFRMIPGLQNAEFFRLGSIHRNTYICSPSFLRPDLSLRGFPRIYFSGQITGVEGYLESAALGLLTAVFVAQRIDGLPHSSPPSNTATGSLLRYLLQTKPSRFQPNNINFGLFEPAFFENSAGCDKQSRKHLMASLAKTSFEQWWRNLWAQKNILKMYGSSEIEELHAARL